MNIKDRATLAHLTGKFPPELRDDPPKPPTDGEIKALAVKLTPEEMRRIMSGPYGVIFNQNVTAALQRLAQGKKS